MSTMTTENDIKDRILSFAREKFMQAGFSKVTLDEIAAELGMSKKTLYKYFNSKEQLLSECISRTLIFIDTRTDEIIASEKSFPDKIAMIVSTIMSQFGRLSKNGAADLQRIAPDQWQRIEIFRREKILKKIGGLLAQGRSEGLIRTEISDELIMLILLSAVQGVVVPEVLMQHSFSAQDALHGIFHTIFMGILTDDARKIFAVQHSTIRESIL